ncbi:mechanosensitive ion channel family protein [Candidatus Woesearchaeota archaeon]|nr:mechanosensitive ion channel family protein [Candidatus Woesearchaeota archaeon]
MNNTEFFLENVTGLRDHFRWIGTVFNAQIHVKDLFLPVSFIVGSFIAGVIFEKVILHYLKKITKKWSGNEIMHEGLGKMPVFWFVMFGVYAAILSLPLNSGIFRVFHKLWVITAIFTGTIVVARIAASLVKFYTNKVKGAFPAITIFSTLIKIVVYIIGFLTILQTLGISITPILTALGVGGLAVALALQDTLSNLFSGFHIIASKHVRPGDYVKLDTGEEGYIADITWRNTIIKSVHNNLIVVPNAKLASAKITNYHLPGTECNVQLVCGVSYGSDLEKVEKVTLAVAKEVMQKVPGGVQNFQSTLRFHTFADSSIQFTLTVQAKSFDACTLVQHELIKRLHLRYRKEKIDIPFPITTVHLKKK